MCIRDSGGAGCGIMNVGRAKVKDQQENQRKATFADVAGADEEKAELQEDVEFLMPPLAPPRYIDMNSIPMLPIIAT